MAKARRHQPRSGLVKLALALPRVAGSLALVAVLVTNIRWSTVIVAGWVVVGLVALTPPGERIVLFRVWAAPDREAWSLLEPIVIAVLARCRAGANQIDWYIAPSPEPNAYAAGRRSIAVTQGMIDALRRATVTRRELEAVLTHEIGHLRRGDTAYAMALQWWTLPWRWTVQPVVRHVIRLLRRSRLQAGTAVVVVAFALIRSARSGNWVVATTLLSLSLTAVVVPLVGAYADRLSELRADAFTADHDLSAELSTALGAAHGNQRRETGSHRLLRHHPDVADRRERLSNRCQEPHRPRPMRGLGASEPRRRPQ